MNIEFSTNMKICFGICVMIATLVYSSQANPGDNATEVDCPLGQMQCNVTRKCIPLSWKCDDDNDCGENDSSDEENCPPKTCASEEFRCNDGTCIPKRWTCDGDPDCSQEDDENPEHCKSSTGCTAEDFTCGDKTCISLNWKCDGAKDCEDGSDELNCPFTCADDQFTCKNVSQCISNAWYCDGDADCLDKTDEIECKAKECKDDEFKCADELVTRCIDIKWKCDGDYDCSDHSDEPANCTGTDEFCSSTEFLCKSGECIHNSWFCDGDKDCLDGSDEAADSGCESRCHKDQFQCANQVCIADTLRCDHNNDCLDGSDELDCNVSATCSERGEFDCYGDGSYCIAQSLLCDGIPKCPQGQDEDPALCPGRDPCLHMTCKTHSHCEVLYNVTATATCKCDRGFELNKTDHTCIDIDECQNVGTCSQICTNTKGGYKCECQEGYLIENHHFCRAKGPTAWLLYANRRDIRRMSVDSRFMEVVVEETTNSIALDYDYSENLLFWTDGGDETIKRARIQDQDHGQVLAKDIQSIHSNTDAKAFSPDGIAVDWVYKHVYWTDTGSDKIKTSNYEGTIVKTIISTDLDDPRAICVDPKHGMIYWSDWGKVPKIERSGMDGSNREVIVKQSQDLEWPNGLTIDYVSRRIYWIDSKLHKIGSANMDGTDHRHVLVDASEIQRPFSISVFEDSLYWTDWHSNKILSVQKVSGHRPQTLSLGSYSVMDVKVYHPMKQDPFLAPNTTECSKAMCEALCLPSANVYGNQTKVVCACDDSKVLNSDNKTCSLAPSTQAPLVTKKPDVTEKTNKPTELPTAAGTSTDHGYTADVTSPGQGYTVDGLNTTERALPRAQESSVGVIAAIVGSVVLIALIVIIAVGFIILRKYKARSKKSMNFDNPVYRKTTTSGSGEEQCMITDEHITPHLQRLDSHENV